MFLNNFNIHLGDIPKLRLAIELAKSICIKLVHQFISGNDENRQNKKNKCKFEGFKFKIDDEVFETKLTEC